MADEKLQFRISSALKNLIGKELITDEYIAVFELVKNSFDAFASKVEIIFENIYENGGERKIIIKDNGQGMNYDDLINKWLFVAYSSKIDDNSELQEERKLDYRNKILSNRIFAGAKGIGRFSCDRLGSKLKIISIKDEPNAKVESILVDWEDFEDDQEKEFIRIKVKYTRLEKNPYEKIKHGTILEIFDLRDKDGNHRWNRKRLLELKHSLEKLINPSSVNNAENFKIELIVKDELQNDKEESEERNRINGLISNFLFETLGIKSTQIKSNIFDNGRKINTILIDRGKEIYKLIENNPYSLRSDIKINLFQLNQKAKINFKKIMGFRSVEFGSVFLYKNGFRIYPFGEEGIDLLGIDRRKQQGYARYLGTREIIGRIEINDPKNIDNLKETTSRDGGLIKNEKYEDLENLFFEKVLKRLERYVVDLIRWGQPLKELGGREVDLNSNKAKTELILLLTNIAKENDVIALEYDKNFLSIALEHGNENLPSNLKNFEILAEKTNNLELQKKARKLINQFKEHNKVLQETKKELDKEIQEKKEKEEELKQRKSQIKFFQSLISRDYDQAINFIHTVGVLAHSVDNNLEIFTKRIKKQKNISTEEVLPFIQKFSITIEKILSYTGFATKANYKVESQYVEENIIEFLIQYVADIEDTLLDRGIKLHVLNKTNKAFIKKFQPIDFKIIFDNLFSNARKVKPKNIYLIFENDGDSLVIKFKDDGPGLSKEIKNYQDIFEMGYTTTAGSGLGLYNVKTILKDENGTIKYNQQNEEGFELIIRINK